MNHARDSAAAPVVATAEAGRAIGGNAVNRHEINQVRRRLPRHCHFSICYGSAATIGPVTE